MKQSDPAVIKQKDLFFINTFHFIQLKMIEECYSLPDDIKYHYKNIEKCFFKAFNLVEPLFTGQTNKVDPPNINPQVLNEIIFELDNELSPRHPIYIGTEQKYYDQRHQIYQNTQIQFECKSQKNCC